MSASSSERFRLCFALNVYYQVKNKYVKCHTSRIMNLRWYSTIFKCASANRQWQKNMSKLSCSGSMKTGATPSTDSSAPSVESKDKDKAKKKKRSRSFFFFSLLSSFLSFLWNREKWRGQIVFSIKKLNYWLGGKIWKSICALFKSNFKTFVCDK